LNPRLAVAYEKRGVLYYFQGKYSEMSEDFLRLAELDPSNSEAHLMLGLAYIKRDEYDRAVESLARAIELNPRLASAYGHRAEAYRLKGMVVIRPGRRLICSWVKPHWPIRTSGDL